MCQEIGLAAYLDALAGPSYQQVSVGTATVAMVLKGLGFSNRRLYLVPQFFATKLVEHLLGPGITAEQLHNGCLGRTLDWLYGLDPTALFAGIEPLHEQVIALLGPSCEKRYKVDGYMGSALQWSENPERHRGFSD